MVIPHQFTHLQRQMDISWKAMSKNINSIFIWLFIKKKVQVYLFNNNNNINMKGSRLTITCMTIITELTTGTRSLIQFQKGLHWLGRTPAMEIWTIQSNYNVHTTI
jgi:hypothetical protein